MSLQSERSESISVIVKIVIRDCQECHKGLSILLSKLLLECQKLMLGNVKIVIKYGQNYCGLSKYMVYRIVKISFSNVKIVVRDWQNGL